MDLSGLATHSPYDLLGTANITYSGDSTNITTSNSYSLTAVNNLKQ